MTDLLSRLRDTFRRRPAEPTEGDAAPRTPVPEIRMPGTSDAAPAPADAPPPADPADALAVAHGQELLGPCRDCGGYWTREVARGQKPLTCPVCKRDGPPGG